MWWHTQRGRTTIIALLLLSSITFFLLHQSPSNYSPTHGKDGESSSSASSPVSRPKDPKLHVLLPSTKGDVNLCKTILSARALGYGDPTILGWGDEYDTWYLLGGGSHIGKITKVLEWLEDLPRDQDDELVLMMDAFDIWFQLPIETFIDRYYSINERANRRLAKQYGKAAEIENIKQTILFGAGKRCAPNQLHTLACYTVPESPIPDDIYGGNTDTIMGRNRYTSLRQRYLNSGYIVGPVKDMRALFRATGKVAKDWPAVMPEDNGSGGSAFMYHGSDQAAFAWLWGQQNYQREVMRRRHTPGWKAELKKQVSTNNIEGTEIGPDILNPPFTHETTKELSNGAAEYGIGVDYFSDLGHQTANAETDVMWLRYDDDIEDIRNQTRQGRNRFDCPYRGEGKIPEDMRIYSSSKYLPEGRSWEQVNLFTNVCLDTIPVMIHYNGDKAERTRQWSNHWVSHYGKYVMDRPQPLGASIYKNRKSEFMGWDELCPAEYSKELFREGE